MSIVWVTGARGFIGQNLSQHLAEQGDRILGLGHGTWPPEIASKSGISYWINGEVESSNLQQLLEQAGEPEVIYHLAGGSSVGLSLQSPAEDFRRSVTATAALLEWIRSQVPQTRLVISSSAAVYGNQQTGMIAEEGQFIPYSPYGFHKRSTELLCQSYAHNFSLKIAIVRLFSVYGIGLRKQLLWDLCCRLQHSPQTLNLHGTGNELRDWFHVEDAVKLLVLAQKLASNEPFTINGGTGQGISVREIVILLCEIWQQSPQIIFSGEQRLGDPFSLVADIQKLQSLNFLPTQTLKSGLTTYVHWFRTTQSSNQELERFL